jgi:threonylcarbamoyladenosine tRNA methylthiotransferase MtaB
MEQPAGDGPPLDLAALLRSILALEGEFRVRLSSLEAAEITPALLGVMAEAPRRVCPHLHIPLQSGSNAVLDRMRRRSTVEEILARCDHIRRTLNEPALTTDVIVGFPGETEADFEASCRVVREVGFSRVHVFRYSPREGTPAAVMPDQVDPAVKQHRAEVLAEIGRRLRRTYYASLVGRDLQVVAESLMDEGPRLLSGTADRYVTVRFAGGPELMDRLVQVTATAVVDDYLEATNARCFA